MLIVFGEIVSNRLEEEEYVYWTLYSALFPQTSTDCLYNLYVY